MDCRVIATFSVETPRGSRTYNIGDLIHLSPQRADLLVQSGRVEPALNQDQQYQYWERSAIMERDGDLDREEAERQAWCLHACMLFAKSQWKVCERFSPKACFKLRAGEAKNDPNS